MRIRELTIEDYDYVCEYGINRGVIKNQPEQLEYSYTLEHEGKVLVIGGIKLINHTTAMCWIALTCWAKEHIIDSYRVISEWMELICKEKQIRCLLAFVDAGFEAGERTVLHLGFDRKCRIDSFNGDSPADLYVRLFEVSE